MQALEYPVLSRLTITVLIHTLLTQSNLLHPDEQVTLGGKNVSMLSLSSDHENLVVVPTDKAELAHIIHSHSHFPNHSHSFNLQVFWSYPLGGSVLIWISVLDQLQKVSGQMPSKGFDATLVISLSLVQVSPQKLAHPPQLCIQQSKLVLPSSSEVYPVSPGRQIFQKDTVSSVKVCTSHVSIITFLVPFTCLFCMFSSNLYCFLHALFP